MKAGLRWGWDYAVAAALVLAPAAALAQDPGQNSSQSAPQHAPTTVGPRELQDFNLQGTVTRPAPTAPATTTPSAPASTASSPPAAGRTTASRSVEAPAPVAPRPRDTTERTADTASVASPPAAAPRLTVKSQSASGLGAGGLASAPSVPTAPVQANDAPHVSLLPWLLAALILAVGGLYLFWRHRSRLEFAGASGFEAHEPAPAPVPPPTPKPMPRAAVSPALAPPSTSPPTGPPPLAGIVSTRLRPWIELAFQPISCVFDDDKVAIEFEIELFNSGNAPARAVLVEARLVNAGREQDQHISAFFANPVGEGQRIVSIPPLKRISFKSALVVKREELQIYNVEGRKVFVPLLAFNVLYSWSSGEGQSSLSYLIGRDTKGEKMAPFRADLGPRTFQGLGKQLLPVGLRQ